MYNPELQPTIENPNIVARELGLKNKTKVELFSALFEVGGAWTDDERANVEAAYHIASTIHEGQTYKEQPYVYHLLRVANRLTGYLHIKDPEIIIAALLHDSVEDRAKRLVRLGDPDIKMPKDPYERQRMALEQIGIWFSPRVTAMVTAVTNAPGSKGEETYEQWLERYTHKVETATQTPEGYLIKFADWCDNGLGIVHSEEPADSPKLAHFKRKYAQALPIFERRFQDDDVLGLLNPEARIYVRGQLALGRQRLTPGT